MSLSAHLVDSCTGQNCSTSDSGSSVESSDPCLESSSESCLSNPMNLVPIFWILFCFHCIPVQPKTAQHLRRRGPARDWRRAHEEKEKGERGWRRKSSRNHYEQYRRDWQDPISPDNQGNCQQWDGDDDDVERELNQNMYILPFCFYCHCCLAFFFFGIWLNFCVQISIWYVHSGLLVDDTLVCTLSCTSSTIWISEFWWLLFGRWLNS